MLSKIPTSPSSFIAANFSLVPQSLEPPVLERPTGPRQGPFRGQGAERRRLVQRVSWREGCQGCLKFVEKTVGQFFDDDESLRRDTALAHVVHLGPDRPLDRLVEVRVLKHDEGVAPAKLQRRLLEV